MATQLCFDPDALRRWIADERARGLALPVIVGMPGTVSAVRLVEMSARIGVGPSMSFLRKQRGLSALSGLFRRSAADRLYDALAADVGDPRLGIVGFHYFTFNQLIATYEWQRAKCRQPSEHRAEAAASPRAYVQPQDSQT